MTAQVTFTDPNASPFDEDPSTVDPLERLTAWAEVRGGSCLAYTLPEHPGVWSFQFDPGEDGPQHPHPDIETAWRDQVRQALTPYHDIASMSLNWEPSQP